MYFLATAINKTDDDSFISVVNYLFRGKS